MQGLPVVVYQDEDIETAAAGVVLVAQDGQLVAAHRHADRFREGANRLFATMAGSLRSQLRPKANVVGSR